MKKILIMLLMLSGLIPSIYFAEEITPATKSNDSSDLSLSIDIQKVNNYLKELEGFIKSHKEYIEDKATGENIVIAEKELVKIFDKYKLNDDEVLEVLNIATKEHDVQKIVNIWSSGDTTIPYDRGIALKYNVFEMTKGYYFERPWFNLPEEEVLMNKILPILNKSKNPAVIRYYLIVSEGVFDDVNNKKLPMSYENKDKFSDKFMEIFRNENNSVDIRRKAIEAWTSVESREKEGIENMEYILENEDLFEITATYLWFTGGKIESRKKILGLTYNKYYRNIIIDKRMFNILENSNAYSIKILNGVLEYFLRGVARLDEDSKKRLREILAKKLEKGTNQDLRKKYENIIKYSNEKE